MEENKNNPPPSDDRHQQNEQLNASSTEQTITPSDETIPDADKPSTPNPQPSTSESMEVHQHRHQHEKKNWRSYFWEFLMLFLAVFCGFLAEYQLEHKIERDREKQFIYRILEDLKEDTSTLSATIKSYRESHEKNDTLILLLSSADVKNQGSALYYLGRSASRSTRLAVHDATIQQLKNSGGLRLIQNEIVAKTIIEYYNRLVFVDYLQKIEDDEIMEYRKLAIDVFHPVLFNGIVQEPNNVVARPPGNPALLTYDSKILLRIAGMVSYIRNTRIGLAKEEDKMKTAANDLIRLIKHEYHLQ